MSNNLTVCKSTPSILHFYKKCKRDGHRNPFDLPFLKKKNGKDVVFTASLVHFLAPPSMQSDGLQSDETEDKRSFTVYDVSP